MERLDVHEHELTREDFEIWASPPRCHSRGLCRQSDRRDADLIFHLACLRVETGAWVRYLWAPAYPGEPRPYFGLPLSRTRAAPSTRRSSAPVTSEDLTIWLDWGVRPMAERLKVYRFCRRQDRRDAKAMLTAEQSKRRLGFGCTVAGAVAAEIELGFSP